MKRFREKTVIVTGAGSDIGRATAIRFNQEGAQVILVGRHTATLEMTAKEFPQDRTWINTDSYLLITCDLSVPSQVQEMLKRVIETFGKIDALINCANEDLSNSIEQKAPQERAMLIQTKSQQVVYLCETALPYLRTTKGNIVNISPFPNTTNHWNVAAYHAVKEEVSALTCKLALDYAAEGVRVNAVNPNISVTEEKLNHDFKSSPTAQLPRHCLGGRFATPSDVAAAITFLASDDAVMITGVNLPVDGGVSNSQYTH